MVRIGFLFLQSELPTEVFRRVEVFWLKMSDLKIFSKKSLKIFCQFKKTLYFCTRKRKRNGFEFVNREEIIKILNIEQSSKERPERVITLSESRKNIQWRV